MARLTLCVVFVYLLITSCLLQSPSPLPPGLRPCVLCRLSPGGGTQLPAVRECLAAFFPAITLCTTLNPWTVVAEGAAIKGASLAGIDRELLRGSLMMDVTPYPIGLHGGHGDMVVAFPANTPLPATGT